MLSISRLVLAVSVAVTFLLVGGTYFLLSGFGDRMLQQSTAQHIQSLAKVTYTSMYQLMNQGWKREQVVAFADNVANSVVGTPLKIDFLVPKWSVRNMAPCASPAATARSNKP